MKAVLVEAVPRDGHAVLNADDPLVRAMRRKCSGQVVWFSMAEPGSEPRDMIDQHCRRGGKALVLEPSERGEMIVVKHGRRRDAAGLDAPAAGDLRRAGPDERPELPRGGRCRLRGRCAPARHPSGTADLLHQLLPLPRTPQRGRGRRGAGDRRLLPQRARHADARRLRRPHRREPDLDQRARAPVADRRDRHRRRPPRRRHARARGRRGPALRRGHRPRGRVPAWPQARRDRRAGGRGRARRAWPTASAASSSR